MFPLGCLIRKKPTGIKIFSSPVAALDSAALAISSGYDENTYSFIPSGDAAGACDVRPATAHAPTASLANNRVILVMKFSLPSTRLAGRALFIDGLNRGQPPNAGNVDRVLKASLVLLSWAA